MKRKSNGQSYHREKKQGHGLDKGKEHKTRNNNKKKTLVDGTPVQDP